MKSVSRGFDSHSGRLIFPVFVLLLFPLRNIRVSLSDDDTVLIFSRTISWETVFKKHVYLCGNEIAIGLGDPNKVEKCRIYITEFSNTLQ